MVGRFCLTMARRKSGLLARNVADPDSPHFDDMPRLVGHRKLAFSRAEVEARSESRFELVRP
jgi:hypothetical protein